MGGAALRKNKGQIGRLDLPLHLNIADILAGGF